MAPIHQQTSPYNREAPDTEGSPGRRKSLVTPVRLERWALYHLGRHASSVANLREILRRRVLRNTEKSGVDQRNEADPWIEALLLKLSAEDVLDDRKYAEALIRRMRTRGSSMHRTRAGLRAKGVEAALADELLRGVEDEDADFEAACRYARRRRLGPFRADSDEREARRQRDLAAFSRAGFSYAVASQVIDADDRDSLDGSLALR